MATLLFGIGQAQPGPPDYGDAIFIASFVVVGLAAVLSLLGALWRDKKPSSPSQSARGTGNIQSGRDTIITDSNVAATSSVINWPHVREMNQLLLEHRAHEIYDSTGWSSSFDVSAEAALVGDKIEMTLTREGGKFRVSAMMSGLRCEVTTPNGFYIADDRARQIEAGRIKEWQLPEVEPSTGFVYPDDFRDKKGTPAPAKFTPGTYSMDWFGYESWHTFEFSPVFIKQGMFRMTPDGELVMAISS